MFRICFAENKSKSDCADPLGAFRVSLLCMRAHNKTAAYVTAYVTLAWLTTLTCDITCVHERGMMKRLVCVRLQIYSLQWRAQKVRWGSICANGSCHCCCCPITTIRFQIVTKSDHWHDDWCHHTHHQRPVYGCHHKGKETAASHHQQATSHSCCLRIPYIGIDGYTANADPTVSLCSTLPTQSTSAEPTARHFRPPLNICTLLSSRRRCQLDLKTSSCSLACLGANVVCNISGPLILHTNCFCSGLMHFTLHIYIYNVTIDSMARLLSANQLFVHSSITL